MTEHGLKMVAESHSSLMSLFNKDPAATPPVNHRDMLRRNLDCAVINHLHSIREDRKLAELQSVRGVFQEGDRLYENSGFHRKTHIQIAIRDRQCILGVFRVHPDILK